MKQPTVERRKDLKKWWDKLSESEKAHMRKLMDDEDARCDDEEDDDDEDRRERDEEDDEAEAGGSPCLIEGQWRLYGVPAADLPALLAQVEAAGGGHLVQTRGPVAAVLADVSLPGHQATKLGAAQAARLHARMAGEGAVEGGSWLLVAVCRSYARGW
jgi:hypothetical protein